MERGIRVTSELDDFLERAPGPVVGIAGSAGKTTTARLLGSILTGAGRRVHVVSRDAGSPLVEQIDACKPGDWIVAELDAALLAPARRSPAIAAVLNVVPPTDESVRSPLRLIEVFRNAVKYQGLDDVAVLGYDNPLTQRLAATCAGRVLFFSSRADVPEGAFLRDGWILLAGSGSPEAAGAVSARMIDGGVTPVLPIRDLPLRGEHNWENALAAVALAAVAGTPVATIAEVLRVDVLIPHHLELVRERAGVRYVDDAVATTARRVTQALRSFEEPIVLITASVLAGTTSEWRALTSEGARVVVRYGYSGLRQGDVVTGDGVGAVTRSVDTLSDAVRLAAGLALPGEIVLFAPGVPVGAGASVGAAGSAFKRFVGEL